MDDHIVSASEHNARVGLHYCCSRGERTTAATVWWLGGAGNQRGKGTWPSLARVARVLSTVSRLAVRIAKTVVRSRLGIASSLLAARITSTRCSRSGVAQPTMSGCGILLSF